MNAREYKMNYAKVLIIDTNIELYNYSANMWARYGIKSHRVDTIELAFEEVSVFQYHLIIIVDCTEQRQQTLNGLKSFRDMTIVPIIIASTDPIDPEYRITGFDLGADEVWELPEHIEEAVAKGNAIIRRYLNLFKENDIKSTMIVNKQIVINITQRLVFVKGNKVELTRMEFDILKLLITYPGRVYTYEQIFSEVWGEEFVGNAKEVLRNRICKLREKLKVESTFPNYIKTNQGYGYSFTPEYDRK